MRCTFLAGAALCAFALPTAAFAEAEAAADAEIVITGYRLAADGAGAGRRPGGTDSVAAREFENVVAVSLRDALAFSPGIYAQPRFGQEVRLSVRGSGIGRGYHMRGLTLLQDGVPLNLADDNGDFQELDPLVLDHIDIYRGANGLRFGSSTLGGAINGVTPTGRGAPGLSLRLDGGSFETLRGRLAYGYADEVADAWVALTGDRSDGDRDHARRRALRFHGNVGLRLGESINTRFYASVQDIDQELPGALDLATAETAPETGNFAGDQARDINSIRLQNRTSVTIGEGELQFGAFANLKQLYHPIFQVVDQKSTDWGGFARLDWRLGDLELTLGSTARFGTIRSRRYVNLNGERGARTFDADLRAHTIDLYGEGRYRRGALSLIAGLVYTQGAREQDIAFPASASGRAEFDQLSPRLGLVWDAGGDVQLFANVSRSHELPGFTELAQITSFVPLDPQRAWTVEIGGRGRIGPARFDISFYRAAVKGELLQFTVGRDIPASTFNADRTLHQGVEASLDLDLAPWARLRQAYQWNDFRFRDDPQYGDNRLPVVPRHVYRAELRLGTDALNVAPVVEWVPEGAWADYRNTLKVDGYATLGLTAEAELREGLSLFLDARNLTGTNAVGDISAVVAATPASVIFYPIERRAFYGGVRARF